MSDVLNKNIHATLELCELNEDAQKQAKG